MSVEKRVLRNAVEVLESAQPLTRAEHTAVLDLAARGLPAEQADRLIRRLRERRSIPAGTLVEVFPRSAGKGPDDSPIFLVRSADGLVGMTRLYNLLVPAPPKRKSRPAGKLHSLQN
jgi:hypothetical protein